VGCGKGTPALATSRENREQGTIDMVQDLGGFMYGCHIILARKTLTDSLAPPECDVFDNKIHEKEGYSTFSLVSLTECGVQTEVSLLERYRLLSKELAARGVTLPVVETTDNHVSRYGDQVIDYCAGNGIVQWSEESMTSGIFQSLDQNNRNAHVGYEGGKGNMKHTMAVALTHKEYQERLDKQASGEAVPTEPPRIWHHS